MSSINTENYYDNQLKSCPFCGGKGHLRKKNRTMIDGKTRKNCYVYCVECDARGKRYLEDELNSREAREKAIEAWNRRVTE